MIRFAMMADAERIAEVHVEAWRAAYRGIVPDSFLAALSIEQRAERWRTILRDRPGHVMVHETNGQIDGWASTGPCRDDDAKDHGEIHALYIAPESWRKGIGRALMAKAEKELESRGFLRIVLWVLDQNERARRFYESAGYAPDGASKEVTFGDAMLPELRYANGK